MLRKELIRISVMTVTQVGHNVADGDKGLNICYHNLKAKHAHFTYVIHVALKINRSLKKANPSFMLTLTSIFLNKLFLRNE